MTNDDNFGPWIDWAGGECPIPDAKAGDLEVKFRDGRIYDGHHPFCYDWSQKDQFDDDIIAYRVRLHAADLLRQAIEALRETIDFMERHSNRWDGSTKHPAVVIETARAVLASAAERGL